MRLGCWNKKLKINHQTDTHAHVDQMPHGTQVRDWINIATNCHITYIQTLELHNWPKEEYFFCLKCSENQSVTITKLSEMYRRRNIKPTDKTTLDSCLSEKQHTRQLYSSSFVPRTLPFIRCWTHTQLHWFTDVFKTSPGNHVTIDSKHVIHSTAAINLTENKAINQPTSDLTDGHTWQNSSLNVYWWRQLYRHEACE